MIRAERPLILSITRFSLTHYDLETKLRKLKDTDTKEIDKKSFIF